MATQTRSVGIILFAAFAQGHIFFKNCNNDSQHECANCHFYNSLKPSKAKRDVNNSANHYKSCSMFKYYLQKGSAAKDFPYYPQGLRNFWESKLSLDSMNYNTKYNIKHRSAQIKKKLLKEVSGITTTFQEINGYLKELWILAKKRERKKKPRRHTIQTIFLKNHMYYNIKYLINFVAQYFIFYL